MDILTPEEKLKEKKITTILYIILCVLPIIALLTVVGYNHSQRAILNYTNEAIKAGNIEEAKEWAMQLDNLEKTDSNNETLLMVACEYGSEEMIDWALAHEADPNFAPRGSTTPLELYCAFGFRAGPKPLVRLLKAGADITQYQLAPPAFRLADKLLWMTPEERQIAFEEILVLYNNGDKIRHNGTTLFHYAAQYDNVELARALLSTMAGIKQLSETDSNGKTPYDLALANGSADVQRLLRSFEQGLLDEINKEDNPVPEDSEVAKDNKAELDALINSLNEQSAKSATSPTDPSEDIEK